MFPAAVSVAGSARVGFLLGAGDPVGANFASNVNVVFAGTVSGTLGFILFLTPHRFFPSLFAPDGNDMIEQTSRLLPLLSLYVFADGMQYAFNGIMKGCGRQVATMPIVVVSYWIIGIPLAYYLAFMRNDGIMCEDDYFCGDVGLVAGMTTGTWVHMLLLGIVIMGTTNWEMEVKKSKERLKGHSA
jgi:MATE family multidrug resistance protein